MATIIQRAKKWFIVEDNQDKAVAFIKSINNTFEKDLIIWVYTDPDSKIPDINLSNLQIFHPKSSSHFLEITKDLIMDANGILLMDIDAPLFDNKTNPDARAVQPLLQYGRDFLHKSDQRNTNLIYLTTAVARVFNWKKALSEDYSRVKGLELPYKISTIQEDAKQTIEKAALDWNLITEYGYSVHQFLEDMNKLCVADCHNWSTGESISNPDSWDSNWSMPIQLAHWIKFLKFRNYQEFNKLFNLTVEKKLLGQITELYKEDYRLSEIMKKVGTNDSPGICLLSILVITWAAFRKHYQQLKDNQLFINAIRNCDERTIPRRTLIVLNQSRKTLNETIIALYTMMDKLLKPREEARSNLSEIGISKSALIFTLRVPFEGLKSKIIEIQRNNLMEGQKVDSSGDTSQAVLNFQNQMKIMDQNFAKSTILLGSNYPMRIVKSELHPKNGIKIIFGYEEQR